MRVAIHPTAVWELGMLIRLRFRVRSHATRIAVPSDCIRPSSRPHWQVPKLSARNLVRSAIEEAIEAASTRVSSQRRDCTITRVVARIVQIRRDLDALTLVVDLNLDVHLAQHALETLHNVLIMPPRFLHAEQEAV